MMARDYIQHRCDVSSCISLLERLERVLTELEVGEDRRLLEEEAQALRQGSFTVAVVGEFKRGKSTLINALLGEEVLPASALPCSAALARVRWGEQPRVKVAYHNGSQREVSFSSIRELGTKLTPEAAAEAAMVREVVVEYPLELCSNGVTMVDTPGLNDDVNMTTVTLSILPQVDAALFVMIPGAPLSQTEQSFLCERMLIQDMGRLIFVVNRIDDIPDLFDRERLLESIRRRIIEQLKPRVHEQWQGNDRILEPALAKLNALEVIGVSSRQALAAKTEDDVQALMSSNFPLLETALRQLLIDEKGRMLLERAALRISREAVVASQMLAMRKRSLDMKAVEISQTLAEAQKNIDNVKGILAKGRTQVGIIQRMALDEADEASVNLHQGIASSIESVVRNFPISIEQFDKNYATDVAERIGRAIAEVVGRLLTRGIDHYTQRLVATYDVASGFLNNLMRSAYDRLERQWLVDRGGAIGSSYVLGLDSLMLDHPIPILDKDSGSFDATLMTTFKALGAMQGGIGNISSGDARHWANIILVKLKTPLVAYFREDYKRQVHQKVLTTLSAERLQSMLRTQVRTAFNKLTIDFEAELSGLIDDVEATIGQIQSRSEGNEALLTAEREKLARLQSELESIMQETRTFLPEAVQIASTT